MVSIQSYDVLRHLKDLANNTDAELALLGDTTLICVDYDEDKTYDYSKYEGEISSILDDLVASGHLIYPRSNKYYISLTAKGIHPFQGILVSIATFLIRSILVPIVVSMLTTLIALKLFGTTEAIPAAPTESWLSTYLHLCSSLFR